MTTTFDFSELAARPACTLSSIEQFAFNEFCRANTDEAEMFLKAQHPSATLSFLRSDKADKPHLDEPHQKQYVYGLKGLSQLLDCSIVTANRIKRSGLLDKAISQIGRKIIIDKDLCLKLANKKGGLHA